MNGCMSLIEIVLDWSEGALAAAIYAGAWAGLLATLVLAINVLFRRWLSASQMGLLWGVVLLRLLIPSAPSSSFSLQNLFSASLVRKAEVSAAHRASVANPGSTASWRPLAASRENSDLPAPPPAAAAPPASTLSGAIDLILAVLPLVWLIGATACLMRTAIVHWRFCRGLKGVAPCDDPRLRTLWQACRQGAGVCRSIPILVFDGVQQPAVLGLFRPRLLLPLDAMELTDQYLRMIMLHELAHVRRWDIAANWALVFIRAMHWWNPVYWLAATRFQSLREQSCDAFAIQRVEGQSIRGYSDLLLTLAQRRPSGAAWRVVLPASLLGFFSSYFRKRAVRNRLTALQSAGVRRSRWHTAGVAGLIGLVAVCGLTDASTPDAAPEDSLDWLPRAGHDGAAWGATLKFDPGPVETRAYDVAKAIARIAVDEPTKDDAREQLQILLTQLLGTGGGHNPASTDAGAQVRLTLNGDTLTVHASRSAHAEIATLLRAWEQSGVGQISIATAFITDRRDIASAIGVSWRYLEAFTADREERIPSEITTGMPIVRATASVDDYLPIAVATLNDQQAMALLQAAQQDRRANLLHAPKVTLFNGQQALISDASQTPFVVGIRDAGAGTQQPKIAIIDQGIKITLRAIQADDARKVHLEGRVELSQIGDVRTASTVLRGEPATIQIPRVKRCRIDVSSEVRDGQSLLIGCIPTYEQKQFFYVLLTVHNVWLPADESK